MRVVAFRGTGLHFQVVDVAVQGLRQLVDELRHAEGPHLPWGREGAAAPPVIFHISQIS